MTSNYANYVQLIRNKEKTILELDAKILEEISEDEHGEEIYILHIYILHIYMLLHIAGISDN